MSVDNPLLMAMAEIISGVDDAMEDTATAELEALLAEGIDPEDADFIVTSEGVLGVDPF